MGVTFHGRKPYQHAHAIAAKENFGGLTAANKNPAKPITLFNCCGVRVMGVDESVSALVFAVLL
jgi:hypothetical protein